MALHVQLSLTVRSFQIPDRLQLSCACCQPNVSPWHLSLMMHMWYRQMLQFPACRTLRYKDGFTKCYFWRHGATCMRYMLCLARSCELSKHSSSTAAGMCFLPARCEPMAHVLDPLLTAHTWCWQILRFPCCWFIGIGIVGKVPDPTRFSFVDPACVFPA